MKRINIQRGVKIQRERSILYIFSEGKIIEPLLGMEDVNHLNRTCLTLLLGNKNSYKKDLSGLSQAH
jgi:hypothetical protein